MRRIPKAPRGRGADNPRSSPPLSRSPTRSPQSNRRSSAASAYSNRSTPTTYPPSPSPTSVNGRRRSSSSGGDALAYARKPLSQLRMEKEQLEAIVKERSGFYQELEEEGDRLARLLGADAQDILAAGSPTRAPDGQDPSAPPMTEEEEIRHLSLRNAQLARELKASMDAERKYSNDPRVLDKRNEVNLVRMQIKQVEKEIQTLQTVKKRRDGALKEIDRSEQMARRVRGQQREVTAELRNELKTLMEQLRKIEKEDVEAHDRHARLQEQVKLGVSESAVAQLRTLIERQQEEIKELSVAESTWKERKEGARDENQRLLTKELKECTRLERDVDRMRAQLIQKEAELRKSYQHVGRAPVTTA